MRRLPLLLKASHWAVLAMTEMMAVAIPVQKGGACSDAHVVDPQCGRCSDSHYRDPQGSGGSTARRVFSRKATGGLVAQRRKWRLSLTDSATPALASPAVSLGSTSTPLPRVFTISTGPPLDVATMGAP